MSSLIVQCERQRGIEQDFIEHTAQILVITNAVEHQIHLNECDLNFIITHNSYSSECYYTRAILILYIYKLRNATIEKFNSNKFQ